MTTSLSQEQMATAMGAYAELGWEYLRRIQAADPELLLYYYNTTSDRVMNGEDALRLMSNRQGEQPFMIMSANELWGQECGGGPWWIPKSDGGMRDIPIGVSVNHYYDPNELLRFGPSQPGLYALVTQSRAIEGRVVQSVVEAMRHQWNLDGVIQMLWVSPEERDPNQGLNIEYVQHQTSPTEGDKALAARLIGLDTALDYNLGGLQKAQVIVVEQVGAMEVGIRDLLAKIAQRPGVSVVVSMAPEDVVAHCTRGEQLIQQSVPIVGHIASEELRQMIALEYGDLSNDFLAEIETMTSQQLLVKIPNRHTDDSSAFSKFWALR